jgi:NADH-quinone oxidoreductase subunit A
VVEFQKIYVYFGLVASITALMIALTWLVPTSKKSKVKFMPYESGIITTTELLQKRFPLRHYLVGLLFLVFDIEVIFLYPWAVVAKTLGSFAFWEILFFLVLLSIGFLFIWKKGGLEWE